MRKIKDNGNGDVSKAFFHFRELGCIYCDIYPNKKNHTKIINVTNFRGEYFHFLS